MLLEAFLRVKKPLRYQERISLSTFTKTFSEIKTAYLIHLLRSFYEEVFLPVVFVVFFSYTPFGVV